MHVVAVVVTIILPYIIPTRFAMAPGERSEEVHLWYTAVYEAVQEIPHGKVTSYGHIARLLGKREHCHHRQSRRTADTALRHSS
jgi:hypothetical protein